MAAQAIIGTGITTRGRITLAHVYARAKRQFDLACGGACSRMTSTRAPSARRQSMSVKGVVPASASLPRRCCRPRAAAAAAAAVIISAAAKMPGIITAPAWFVRGSRGAATAAVVSK